MYRKKTLFVLLLGICLPALSSMGKDGKSTYKIPEGLVKGAAFIDRFLPVPLQGELRSDVWGADNVIPRDVNNGIEAEDYSYWGGNIIRGDDDKEHLFVCRWSSTKVIAPGKEGHRLWPRSTVVHAVSDSPLGPFKVVDVVGKGHNPEIYRKKDGTYILGILGAAYRSETLDGPWEKMESVLDSRMEYTNTSNKTYVVRDDGSVLMMNKQGVLWISEKADEHFKQVTDRVYPQVRGAKFEDPVIWKDEVQYHCIVNDWYGRTAFHLRSFDGIEWKCDPGIAYDPSIMRYEDGTQESWYKFERPKVRQDEYGRATHMNFAVIDVVKNLDKANDKHSSKNVVIPLVVSRRLEVLNTEIVTSKSSEIRVKILAESGFNPHKDIDVKSLRFGAPEAVDFGGGCKSLSVEKSGSDLVVTFAGEGNGITADNFAGKLLGRTSTGKLLLGFAQLPGYKNELKKD